MLNKKSLLGIALCLISLVSFSQTSETLIKSSNSSKDIKSSKPIYSKKIKARKEAYNTKNINTPVVNSQKSSSSYDVGTTLADFSVSLSGGASYNIPFATPPGIKDINPNMSLTFNSQSSNGLAGWGWNVSGLSTISRVGSTKFHDGFVDGVDYDSYDRFSLDGQRLILKSGTYGVSGSEYQTETYSNLKVKAYGTSPYGAAYGPSHFVVFYPDGSRAWYGNGPNSRGKLEWAIYKKQDPQGNYIQYEYTTTNGLKTIDKVKFGSKVGTTPPIVIHFFYKNRKRPELAYVNGEAFKRTNILDRVDILGNGTIYRQYKLTHDETSLGYERLISVQEVNGLNSGLTPINFTYDSSTNNNTPNAFSRDISPLYDHDDDTVLTGEFNGDDNLDFILYNNQSNNQIHIFDNIFEGSGTIEIGNTYNVPQFDKLIGSNILNHDGKLLSRQGITLINENVSGSVKFNSYYQGTTGNLSFQYLKTWNAPTYTSETSCENSQTLKIPKDYVSGDFNGDGLTDVFAITKPYSYTNCVLEDPNCTGNNIPDRRAPCPCTCNTTNYNISKAYFIDLNRNLTSNFVFSSGNLLNKLEIDDKLIAADFNGDGKTDLFHFKEGKVFIYQLNEYNQLELIDDLVDSDITLNKPILLGDFNGDSRVDFITPKLVNNSTWNFFLSESNDIYKYSKDIGVTYLENSSTPFFNYSDGPTTFAYVEWKYLVQDVNGDGKSDIVKQGVASNPNGHQYSDIITGVFKNVFSETDTTPSFTGVQNHYLANSGVGRYGIPLLLNINRRNDNIEYAYLSTNSIALFEYEGNHRKEISLKQINNNGVVNQVDYFPLNSEDVDYEHVYNGEYDQIYPFINVNIAPSIKMVKEVREIGSGLTRTQNYKYRSAISHAHGLGFLGFKQFKKSNWQGTDVQTVWSISNQNPQNRGAISQQWTSLSYTDLPSNYISKTDYTYQTQLTNDNVFINRPTQIVSNDALSGVTKTKSFTYDQYFNPSTITNSFSGGSETTTLVYSNNTASNGYGYHVGRVLNKTIANVLGSETFSTQEIYYYNYNLLIQLKKKGNNTPWIDEYYQHDAFGNLTQKRLSATGIADRIENFEYDISGRFQTKKIDIEGLETTYTYQASTGNPQVITNPYGLTTQFQYDGWARTTRSTNYLGKHTYYTYANSSVSGAGGLLKTTNYEQGQDEKTYYNAFGWIVREAALGLNNKWIQVDTEYDVAGRIIKSSQPYFSTGSASQWDLYYFDEYGRPYSEQSYTGRVFTTTYSGLTATVDDGVKTVTKTSDAIGNIITHQDPGGTINYTYYTNGVMKTADYDSHIVSVTIDGWGRKTELNDPSAGNYSYTYSIIGEILTETTPKGTTTYTYDDFGKVTTKEILGDQTDLSLQYFYDATTKQLSSIDGLDSINQRTYDYSYEYDTYQRIKKTRENTDFAKYTKEVAYDTYGRVASEIYDTYNINTATNSNIKTKNVYDTAGITTEVRDFNSNNLLWEVTSEDARGNALNINLGNGFAKSKTFDQYGYLTNINDFIPFSNNTTTALKMDYIFNTQRGTLTSRDNYVFDNWQETFAYDDLERLTQISGDISHSQSYDGRGRILNNSFIGDYVYDANATYQASKVNLNNQGDLYYQQHSLQQVTYNAFKKPVEITEKNHGAVSFEYGPMMNRANAFYGGEIEDKTLRQYHKHYSSIMSSEIIEDTQSNTTKIITYIGGNAYKAPIAHIKQTGNNTLDEYHYLHRDYLGSILAITDADGDIKEQTQFGAWGIVDKYKKAGVNTAFTHDSLLGRGYTAHEHFFEVSLIHMNGRMYDAKLGRFLSPDNFVQDPYNTQSFNRYGYVWNNPLSFNDPSGEFFVAALIGAAIGVIVNGIVNTINGEGFFEGALESAVIGALTGALAFGVGEAVKGLEGVMKVVVQTVSHAHIGGVMAGFSGGEYLTGFASGAFASIMSYGVGHAVDGVKKAFWRNTAIITSGGIAGGVGSSISGGKFWDGVRNGLISSTLNHVMHSVVNNIDRKSKLYKLLDSNGVNPDDVINYSDGSFKLNAYARSIIDKIPELSDYFTEAGSPILSKTRGVNSYYDNDNETIYLSFKAFSSNFRFVSTLFHELTHAFQYKIGYAQSVIKLYGKGSMGKYGKARALLEMQAYSKQLSLGDSYIQNDKYYLRYKNIVDNIQNHGL